MTNFTIKIEKDDIKTSEIGNNIMINCENNISLIFTKEALEELVNDYNHIKKDNDINEAKYGKRTLLRSKYAKVDKVLDNIISETSHKEMIKEDFATKEQRDTFNEIMCKITGTKN